MTIGCGRGGEIARLTEATGAVEREVATAPGWHAVGVGQRFSAGDGVRTGPGAGATLRLSRGGGLRVGEQTIVRFLIGGPGGQGQVAIETGSADIEGGGERGVRFDTALGLARIETGTTVRVHSEGGGPPRLEVLVGAARLEQDGRTASLGAGQAVAIRVGTAQIERRAPPPPDAARLPPPDAAAPDAAPPDAVSPSGDAAVGPAAQPARPALEAEVRGRGVQQRAADGRHWETLPAGAAELQPGSHLRVPAGARLRLVRGGENATALGAAEVEVGAPGDPLLSTQRGRVLVEARGQDVRIRVPGGVIVVHTRTGGARAEITVPARGPTQVAARLGSLDIRGRGAAAALDGGESANLARDGAVEMAGRSPTHADVEILAGESPTVHDPRPSTAVRIRFGDDCANEGQVDLLPRAGGRTPATHSRGDGSAIVLVPPGAWRYQVRCVDDGEVAAKPEASGQLRVLRDAGAARLPRTAPHNIIEADGRPYTVLYQNRLPDLTIRWPQARAGVEASLRLKTAKGAPRTVPAPGGSHHFASGELAEGTYRLSFASGEGPAETRSAETVLRIGFDNAAPAAYLREPAEGFHPDGDEVTVAGAAIEGATVYIDGEKVDLDGQQRFNETVDMTGHEGAISVRISHPSRGVHYYLRRLATTTAAR
jgi:hypothetical protein